MDGDSKRSPWLIIEGVVLILLGVVALLSPLAAGIALSLLIGVVLIVSGLVGMVSAFAGRDHAHPGFGFASSGVALAIGLALIFYPLAGPVVVAILLGVYLLGDGVFLIGLAMDHRKRASRRWGWLLASGVLDLVLGAVLLLLGAAGSATLLGVFIGIDLIVAGVALVLIHRATVRETDGVLVATAPGDASEIRS